MCCSPRRLPISRRCSRWRQSEDEMNAIFGKLLWLAGFGHFCVLIASFQVPVRMRWREDLTKLMPVNRKLMWTYGAFIVLTIVAFGTLTLALHDELLRGDRSALGLAGFIGAF